MRNEMNPVVVTVVIVLVVLVTGAAIWWRSNAHGDGTDNGGFAKNEKLKAAIGQKYREETSSMAGAPTDQPPAATNQPAGTNQPPAQPQSLGNHRGGRNLRGSD